ncbi:hypothetical protein ACTXT7_007316 [Hymenolepis weldensis]
MSDEVLIRKEATFVLQIALRWELFHENKMFSGHELAIGLKSLLSFAQMAEVMVKSKLSRSDHLNKKTNAQPEQKGVSVFFH